MIKLSLQLLLFWTEIYVALERRLSVIKIHSNWILLAIFIWIFMEWLKRKANESYFTSIRPIIKCNPN